jgi:type II secretory ATPase GspE/PulE/Tfp pilus assembly ATPase PilB-like protein
MKHHRHFCRLIKSNCGKRRILYGSSPYENPNASSVNQEPLPRKQLANILEKQTLTETPTDNLIAESQNPFEQTLEPSVFLPSSDLPSELGDLKNVLHEALHKRASDIHFEPEPQHLRIRYRVDGQLMQIQNIPPEAGLSLCMKLKIMANMNIAETRTPQSGRFQTEINRRPIDFRVSTHPTIYGENIVLRLLDKEKGLLSLDQLGFSEQVLITLRNILSKERGLFIVTGPTGSGKTTTLYSILMHLCGKNTNIVSKLQNYESAEVSRRMQG